MQANNMKVLGGHEHLLAITIEHQKFMIIERSDPSSGEDCCYGNLEYFA